MKMCYGSLQVNISLIVFFSSHFSLPLVVCFLLHVSWSLSYFPTFLDFRFLLSGLLSCAKSILTLLYIETLKVGIFQWKRTWKNFLILGHLFLYVCVCHRRNSFIASYKLLGIVHDWGKSGQEVKENQRGRNWSRYHGKILCISLLHWIT